MKNGEKFPAVVGSKEYEAEYHNRFYYPNNLHSKIGNLGIKGVTAYWNLLGGYKQKYIKHPVKIYERNQDPDSSSINLVMFPFEPNAISSFRVDEDSQLVPEYPLSIKFIFPKSGHEYRLVHGFIAPQVSMPQVPEYPYEINDWAA